MELAEIRELRRQQKYFTVVLLRVLAQLGENKRKNSCQTVLSQSPHVRTSTLNSTSEEDSCAHSFP